MASSETISITYKLEGDNKGFKTLAVDADGLRKVLGESIKEAERLKSSAINFAAVATSIDSVSRSFDALKGVLT